MLPHDDSGQLVVGTKNWLTPVPCGPYLRLGIDLKARSQYN